MFEQGGIFRKKSCLCSGHAHLFTPKLDNNRPADCSAHLVKWGNPASCESGAVPTQSKSAAANQFSADFSRPVLSSAEVRWRPLKMI